MMPDRFVRTLLKSERDAVTRVMAFMSHNPSISRVLEGGGVKKFERVARRLVRALGAVRTQAGFDRLHAGCVSRILTTFRTSRGGKPSYGQAAKPINVFLKVYVDWASRPNGAIRRRILPFLHVPLDSVLMDAIRYEDPTWYRREIHPHVRGEYDPYSLSHIDRAVYWKWHHYFRARWPKKPILFDIAWAIHRDETS